MTGEYVSPLEIIADVTSLIDDEGLKEFSEGFHLSNIQQALQELAYDTYFDEKIYVGPVPHSLILDLPDDIFKVQQAWLYNGNVCGAGDVVNLWSARHYTRHGGAMFKEQRGDNNGDPIMENVMSASRVSQLYFFNIRDGRMHLSDACAGLANIKLHYVGTGCPMKSSPIVPSQFRQAVKHYAAKEALNVLFARNPQRWGAVLANVKSELDGDGYMRVGSWKQAQRRAQSIDPKMRDDIAKYLSSLSELN